MSGVREQLRLLERDELPSILPLVQILNPSLPRELLAARLQEMISQGYQCLGVFCADQLVAIAGLWIHTHFWSGRMIEPDNVVVHPDYRSSGLGERMMAWIYEYGREQGCVVSDLNCYITNHGGHKFWANQGYKILGFHYQKDLG